MWDTGGRHSAVLLGHDFFRNACGVLLVFDASSPSASDSLDWWSAVFWNQVCLSVQTPRRKHCHLHAAACCCLSVPPLQPCGVRIFICRLLLALLILCELASPCCVHGRSWVLCSAVAICVAGDDCEWGPWEIVKLQRRSGVIAIYRWDDC